jgi:hypothetical protein
MDSVLFGRLRPAQAADALDETVPIRVPYGLNEVPPFGTVARRLSWSRTRRQMPFDPVAFASRADLTASANEGPPVDSRLDGCGWFGFSLACGPLAAGV